MTSKGERSPVITPERTSPCQQGSLSPFVHSSHGVAKRHSIWDQFYTMKVDIEELMESKGVERSEKEGGHSTRGDGGVGG